MLELGSIKNQGGMVLLLPKYPVLSLTLKLIYKCLSQAIAFSHQESKWLHMHVCNSV